MWNLLAGYGGLVSIGQQAFVGLGGYALLVLADDAGVNPFLAVPLAGLVAALRRAADGVRSCSGCRAATSRSAPGSIAEVFRLLVANTRRARRRLRHGRLKAVVPAGIARRRARWRPTAWRWPSAWRRSVAVYLFLRSRYGLALMAIRDSESRLETLGIDVFRHQARGLRRRRRSAPGSPAR